ncbi:MAG: sodium/solute symporter [Planctomycetota bacterium]
MKLSVADIAIFVFYFGAIGFIGFMVGRRTGGSRRDYFLAGDKLPWWMVGGSIVAANISSHHFIGVIGTAYSRGFVAMVIEWGAILIGFNALLWVFLPFYLRNGFYTMPEFLQKRFGTGARSVYAILILITYIFVEVSAVLYLGAIALHSLFGLPVPLSIIVLAVFTGIYTIMGGLRAVVWTEMVQLGVLLAGGLVLAVASLRAVGGWEGFMAASGDWHLILPATDQDFPWTMYLGGVICVSVFYCAANQFIVQRTLAAKNEWHARMGVVFTQYLKFFLPLIIVVPGLIAPRLFPNLERPDMAFPTLVQNLLPQGLVGLVMAGLIAAVMSHLSGAVNACMTILTVDIYQAFINKHASDAQAVRFGKLTGLAVMGLGILWSFVLVSHSDKPVFIYLLNAYGYVTPGIAAMFLMGILWRGTTPAAALTVGLLTIPLSVAIEKLAPLLTPGVAVYVTPFWNRTGIVFWTCMLVCALVSLVTTPKPREALEGLIWNRESLRLPAATRAAMSGVRNPFYWWAAVTLAVLYFYVRYW